MTLARDAAVPAKVIILATLLLEDPLLLITPIIINPTLTNDRAWYRRL